MPSSSTLHDMAARRALTAPSSVVGVFPNQGVLTTGELVRRAERLASKFAHTHRLRASSRLLVVYTTGPDLLASLIAGWHLGALIAPTDVALSDVEFDHRLDDFRPDLVVIDREVCANSRYAELCRARGIPLGDISDGGEEYPPPTAVMSPSLAALCIYTSGSTGMPRGVVLSHAALLEGARNVVVEHSLTADDRVLCVLPLSHLNGLVTTFLAPLISGGSVVYMPAPFEPAKAVALIDSWRCTWFSAVPTHYAWMMRPPLPESTWALPTLKFCRSASAPLSVQVLEAFEAHYGVPIIETMGMTETAGQIFANSRSSERRKPGSVGRPVGFDARIVDEQGRVCATGETGEIEVRGAALMAGYLDDPAETARAFDDGWLRTGDIGRRDEDGFYFITGRKKEIAIFAGSNISLRALDEVIRQTSGVADGACAAAPSPLFGEQIDEYVVCANADLQHDVAGAAADALRQRLPSPQALGSVHVVAELPRSPVGKLLRGRLRDQPILYNLNAPTWTTAKSLLSKLLKLPESAIDDTMQLGTVAAWDSLAHVVLALEMESRIGRALSVEETLALTTLHGLERVLAAEPIEALAGELEPARDDLATLMMWNGLLPRSGQEWVPRATGRNAGRIAKRDVIDALTTAGLKSGDAVLVHSDITAIGPTEAGWDREALLELYLDAFRAVVGDAGTIAVCTSFEDYGRYGTPFVWEESPSRLGAFSEFVRTRPGSVRSMHPIVSVTSLGGRAREISGGIHFDAFGYESPWGRLHRLDAMVMTLGMLHYPEMGLTFLHYIEQLYGVPYQYNKVYTAPVLKEGRPVSGPFTMSVRYLDYGITYDTNKFKERAIASGVARQVALGANGIFAARTNALVAEGIRALSGDRYFFLKDPPTFRPGEVPMDGATGSIRYVYDKSKAQP